MLLCKILQEFKISTLKSGWSRMLTPMCTKESEEEK